jgi:predicted alpha/beta superfamily hydrolase
MRRRPLVAAAAATLCACAASGWVRAQARAGAAGEAALLRWPALPSAHVVARDVDIWLPPGYATDITRRYPVLYLHDGQNLFNPQAFHGGWRAGQTAQALLAAGEIAPFILVGIHNTPERLNEYTPMRRLWRGALHGGGGAAYARFLLEELKPQVDAQLRTRPEAQATSFGGASLAGLHAMWMALQFPHTVGSALVVSPAVWWDDKEEIAQRLRHWPAAPHPRPRLWLCIGSAEGDEALQGARLWQAAARKGGFGHPDWRYTEAAGAAHNEAAWAERFAGMLRFLYQS